VTTRLAVLLALGLGLGACTVADGIDDAGSVGGQIGSIAVVRIERTLAADGGAIDGSARLRAAFARYRGLEASAVIELLDGEVALDDECAIASDPSFDPLLEGGAAKIELVDWGVLEVSTATARAAVSPRTFPDLGGIVNGVFYAADAPLGDVRAEEGEYFVRSAGSAPFAVAVPAPDVVRGLVAAGGSTGLEAFTRGEDVALEWDAGDPADEIEIDVHAGATELRCVAYDDGSFVIGASLTASLELDSEARVFVRRVRREPFALGGYDAAWLAASTEYELAAVVR
jgi:hypothetical protein